MVSAETLLSLPDWRLPFKVHTDEYDKQLGDVISQNNNPTASFSIIPRKPQRNYTTTKKEIIVILECLKQLGGILFGYEIYLFSVHKNLFNATTLSEPQRVILWQLILEEFGPNI